MATLYHVRKSSLEDESKSLRYVGIRDISDTEKIKEEDIVDKDGTVIGVKNRVRAGLQHFAGHVREVITCLLSRLTSNSCGFSYRDRKRKAKSLSIRPASRQ